MIKDVNDQLMNRVELCALDGCTEQDPIYYRSLMAISGKLSVLLIKQFKRICKWGKGFIFIGDLLMHREFTSFNFNAVNREIKLVIPCNYHLILFLCYRMDITTI